MSTDIADPMNWTTNAVPTDIAQLDYLGKSTNHTTLTFDMSLLDTTSITLTEILLLPTTNGTSFDVTATPFVYTLTVGTNTGVALNFSGTNAVGINNQTGNLFALEVIGTVTGGSIINFNNNSSSDAANSGNVLVALEGEGTINYNNSAHTNSTLFFLLGNPSGNNVNFNNFASSNDAQFVFTAAGANITYNDNSTAGNAFFNLSGATGANPITFEDSSSADDAFIDFGTVTTGVVNFNQSANNTFNGQIVGAGSVHINNPFGTAVTTTFTEENSYTGGTTIGVGELALVGSGSISDQGALSLTNALSSLDISQKYSGLAVGQLFGVTGSAIFLGENNLTSHGQGPIIFNGVISGQGSFTIDATVAFLSGANTYTGGTILKNGASLFLASTASLAPTGPVTLFGPSGLAIDANQTIGDLNGDAISEINLGAFTLTINGLHDDNFLGFITDSGSGGGITKTGTNILTLGSGTSFYLGNTNIQQGTLRSGGTDAFSLTSLYNISSGATLDLDNFNDNVGTLSGSGFVDLGSGTLTINNTVNSIFAGTISGTGGVTLNPNAGILTLSGLNTYTGPTLIGSTATLSSGATNSFAPLSDVTDNGTLDLADNNNTIGSLSGFGNVTLGAGTLSLGGSNLSTIFTGAISGTGGLIKNGEGTFQVNNGVGALTYLGTTQVNSGVFQSGFSGSFPANSPVVLNHTGTLDLNGNTESILSLSGTNGTYVSLPGASVLIIEGGTTDEQFGGSITGAGQLAYGNMATLQLYGSGNNTYSGQTTLGAGIFQAGAENVFSPNSLIFLDNIGLGTPVLDLNGFDNIVSQISDSGTTGPTQISLGAGTLTLVNQTSSSYGGNITSLVGTNFAQGGLTLQGPGALTLSGINTYAGPTLLEAGSIIAGSITALSSLSDFRLEDSSLLNLNGFRNTIGSLAGSSGSTVDVTGATLTLGGNNIDTIFAGTISGAGGNIIKTGCGTLRLCGANTFDGFITISGGKIELAGTLASPNNLLLQNNGIFDVSESNGITTIGNLNGDANTLVNLGNIGSGLEVAPTSPSVFNGTIAGNDSLLLLIGPSSLTLGGVNTFTGFIAQIQGDLILTGSLNPTIEFSQFSGTFDISGIANSQRIGDLSGSGAINLGAKELIVTSSFDFNDTYTGTINGSGGTLTKDGPGSLTLGGVNTYTGPTNIDAGSLILTGSGNLSPLSNLNMESDTTFDISTDSSSIAIGSLSGGDETTFILLGANSLTVNSAGVPSTTTFGGIISGTGGLTLASGTLTLTGDSTFTGTTNVSGNLFLKDDGNLQSSVNLFSGSLFDISGVNREIVTILNLLSSGSGMTVNLGGKELVTGTSSSTIFNGVISGSDPIITEGGKLTKVGTGTLTLTAPSTYTGGTNIVQGTLDLSGSGNLSPTGNVTVFSGATFSLVGSTTPVTIGDLNGQVGSSVNLASGQLTVGNGQQDNAVFSGVISGLGGRLIKTGLGKLTLNGLSSYTGGTIVSQGTLEGNTTTLQGNIVDNATLIFNQNFNGIYNQLGGTQLLGNGVIIKKGTGILAINSNNPGFSGTTYVENGKLALNALLGGQIIVQENGSISGVGTVSGNLIVDFGGTVAPGNSIGTLFVGGNYVQEPSGTYQVQINGAGNSSLIQIGGSANLFVGKVFVTSLDGLFAPNTPYVIINAAGGRIGLMGEDVGIQNVTFNPNLLHPALLYTNNQVIFEFITTLKNAAVTPNELAVATQLDSIMNPDAFLSNILRVLVGLSDAEVAADLATLSGEQFTYLPLQSELLNRQFIRRLYDPLRPYVACIPCDMDQCTYYDWESCEGTPVLIWGDFSFTRTHVDGNRNAQGIKIDGYEFTLGAHRSYGHKWVWGLAFSYEHDYTDFDVGGDDKTNSFLTGVYGLYRPEKWYTIFDLTYSYSNHSFKRPLKVGPLRFTAKSHPHITQLTNYLEAGYDIACYDDCSVLLQPFIGLETDFYWMGGIRETGASELDLSVKSKFRTEASSRLGVHIGNDTSGFVFSIDAAWQFRLTSMSNQITNNFSFGTPFAITGVKTDRNSFDGSIYFSKDLGCSWRFYGELSGEVWRNANTITGLLGLEAEW